MSADQIKTERLLLRPWQETDFSAFAQMNADPEVMSYFPAILSRQESDELGDKIQSLIVEQGWGLWAVEVPEQAAFIGFVGLHRPKGNLPCAPCVEVGWRLAKAHWGKGYATEAARACLDFAFKQLQLLEVVSFTATSNLRSQYVMQALGMQNSGNNFHHPDLPPDHPLAEHVLYKLSRNDWQLMQSKGSAAS